MWVEVMEMVVALVAFVGFPFVVIGVGAGLLVLFDHVLHFTNHNHDGHHAA